MADEKKEPKIVVDSDWKAQAQAEKERLTSETEKAPEGHAGPEGPMALPPANFETLVTSIASQALFSLGAMPDPQTNRRYVNLDMARHEIDTLKVLEEKTAGNLTEEEKALLNRSLYELRTAYVQIAQRMSER